MPLIKYIEDDGKEYEVDVAVGESIMQGAVDNLIDGIVAECGGSCSCATCHCYVDAAWIDKIQPADSDEMDMLDAVLDKKENSRLSCQIPVTEAMEGFTVRLPESQL